VTLHPDQAIRQPQVGADLRGVLRHLRGPVIVTGDRLNVHRGKQLREFVARHPRLPLEQLPAYAPELNAVEPMWGHANCHRWGNSCPDSVAELADTAHHVFSAYQEDQDLLRGFIRDTKLPLRLPPRKYQPDNQ
jgi:transposase